MSEPANTPTPSQTPKKPRSGRKLRRLLIAVVVIFVGIIGLILFAPTLLSTAPARSIVLRIVNKKLNGRVDVTDWSLGWFSGVRVSGVKLSDVAGKQIASVDSIAIPMPLWRAATGKYPIGESKIDGVTFDAVVGPDGSLNFSNLARSEPQSAPPAGPSAPVSSGAGGFSIPPVFGSLAISHVHGTLTRPDQPVLTVDSLNAAVSLPQFDGPVTAKVDSSIRTGNQPATAVAIDVSEEIKRGSIVTLGAGKATVTARQGGDSADSIDLGLTVTPAAGSTVAFHTDNGKADLVRLNKQFAFVPANLLLTGGSATIATAGTFDPTTSTITLKPFDAGVADVTLSRAEKSGKPTPLLHNWVFNTHVEGSASFGSVVSATIHTLNLTDSLNLVSITRSGPGDLAFTRSAAGEFAGPGGTIAITADIPQIMSLLQKFQGTTQTPDEIKIKSAWDTQTLTVAPQKQDLHITLGGGVHQFILSGPGGDTTPAEVPITADATVSPDFSRIALKQAGFSSPFAAVSIDDAVIAFAGKTPLQKLVKATIHTDVPDLKTAMAVGKKFQKPEPPVAGQPPVQPLEYDSGSILGTTEIVSSGTGLDVTTAVSAKDVSTHTGNAAPQKLDPITFQSHLLLTPTAAADDYDIAVKTLTAGFDTTKSMILSIDDGSVGRVETARDLKLTAKLSYDLAKLWPTVKPYLSASMQSMKITGIATRPIVIGGSYPAGKPFNDAVKTLKVDGSVAVDSFDYDGVKTDKGFVFAFAVRNGMLTTNPFVANDNTNVIFANGGQIHTDRWTIDLTQAVSRLTLPPNYLLIEHFSINPLFASTFLANFLNNPLFVNTPDATGQLTCTIIDCTNEPLGSLATEAVPANNGTAKATVTISDLNLGVASNPLTSQLKQNSFVGRIEATVQFAKGMMNEHLVMITGSYSLPFDGVIRLSDKAMMPLTIQFPLNFIAKTHLSKDPNVLKLIPDTVPVGLKGTVDHLSIDGDVLGKAFTDASKKAVTQGLLGNGKNGKAAGDALNGLLNQLGKKNK